MPQPRDSAKFIGCIDMLAKALYCGVHVLDQAADVPRPLVRASEFVHRGLCRVAAFPGVCQAAGCAEDLNSSGLWQSGVDGGGESTARALHLGVHVRHGASRILSHGGG